MSENIDISLVETSILEGSLSDTMNLEIYLLSDAELESILQ